MKRFIILLYQIFIWVPLVLTITILTALTTIIGCSLGGERIFSYYPGMYWSKLFCLFSLCPVKIKGREKLDKKQSYIFVANHQGIYDIFLIYGFLHKPIKWVMKKSLEKIPFVGYACKKAGFIFVDNSSPKAALKTIEEAEARLKNGASIAIFPEGSRTRTGKLGSFKKGAYQMAMDLNLPIVPISINGSYEVMPIDSYFLRPHKMELIIHDPIPTNEVKRENMREMAVEIRRLTDESKEKIVSGLWHQYKETTE